MLLWFRFICLALAGFTCAALALGGGACVIAPPPELPPLVHQPPRILHDSVVPPAGLPLPAWPWPITPNQPLDQLLVPIVVDDLSAQYQYRVLVDYPQWPDPLSPNQLPSPPPVVDGGAILAISINPDDPIRTIDLSGCHQIEVVVALSFLPDNITPDSLGGDSVSWTYYPSSSVPYTCSLVEAGAPPGDASAEILPVPPLSEGGEL